MLLGKLGDAKKLLKNAIQLGIKNIDIFYNFDGIKKGATISCKRNKEG